MKKIKSLEFNRDEILLLFNLLVSAKLPAVKNLSRNRLVRQIREKIDEFEALRIDLARNHARKDSQGNPIIENVRFVIDNMPAFEKELGELVKSFKFVFDVLPSNEEDWSLAQEIAGNTNLEFDYGDGSVYESLLNKLGSLHDRVNK